LLFQGLLMAREEVTGDFVAACGLGDFANIRRTDAIRKAAAAVVPMERLEDRRLFSSVSLTNGVLSLSGDDGRDNSLTVTLSGSNYVAKANTVSKTVSASSVKSIKIFGANQKDTIKIDTKIA